MWLWPTYEILKHLQMAVIRKKLKYVESDPKVYASLRAGGSGLGLQSYNAASGEYYPERSLMPLVLTPAIGYRLPDTDTNVSDAADQLTDGHWYRLDGTNSSGLAPANEITNGMPLTGAPGMATDRFVIDTTPGSKTYGRIEIYENTQAEKPVTYVFVATLNVGKKRKVKCSYISRCKAVTVIPEVLFDNAQLVMYNPLEDRAVFAVTPKLSPSTYAVAWSWETWQEGKWGALGSTLLDWDLSVDAATGKLTIDRTHMPDDIKARCVATVTVDDVQIKVRKELSVVRRVPKFEADFIHVADLNEGMKTINPLAVVKMGNKVLSDPTGELLVAWMGTGTTPIAYGMNPAIAVSLLGTAMELGLDVRDRGGWRYLALADGTPIVDGTGKIIIARPNPMA